MAIRQFAASLLLLSVWNADAARLGGGKGRTLDIRVYTFNLGELSKPEHQADIASIVDDVLLDARKANVKLVSINFQEAPNEKTFLIRPVPGWRVIRTRHLCNEEYHFLPSLTCNFALFSFLYIADYTADRQTPLEDDILGVRTLKFTADELEHVKSAIPVHDKYADGCGGANESNEMPLDYWGGVMHVDWHDGLSVANEDLLKAAQRCHAVAVRHEEWVGVAAKASLVTRYRVTYMADDKRRSFDFVVSTSHFGKIPSAEEMFRLSSRSKELNQAVNAVQIVSDDFAQPVFMTGDWNFRMVPFGELAQLADFEGLHYTGPVLHLVDEVMRYGWVHESPMQAGVAYEETRVAAVALDGRYVQKLRLHQKLKGFPLLYEFFTTSWRRMPTCRFRESVYRSAVFQETVPLAKLDAASAMSTAEFLSMSGENEKWAAFQKQGYDLIKMKKDKGSKKPSKMEEERLVTRLPSQCDQIFWSNTGDITKLTMGSAWDVLGTASKRKMMTSDHNMLELRAMISLA